MVIIDFMLNFVFGALARALATLHGVTEETEHWLFDAPWL